MSKVKLKVTLELDVEISYGRVSPIGTTADWWDVISVDGNENPSKDLRDLIRFECYDLVTNAIHNDIVLKESSKPDDDDNSPHPSFYRQKTEWYGGIK